MPGWLRLIRGMIGMGLTFSAGVAVVAAMVGVPMWLFFREFETIELLQLLVRPTVIAFPIGVLFSGLLAITARGRGFDKLSLPRFGALGAGVGVLLWLLMGINGAFHAWTPALAIGNLTLLTVLGGGSATATLFLARRGRPALKPDDEPHGLIDL